MKSLMVAIAIMASCQASAAWEPPSQVERLESRVDSMETFVTQEVERFTGVQYQFYNHEYYQDKRNAKTDRHISKVSKESSAGISSALAASAIPQVLSNQRYSFGAAIGGYQGESAIAVGLSARATESLTVKASVGADSQNNVSYAAGASFGY